MSASTWTDIGVEMKRLGAIADRAEAMRAVGPYVRDGGRWRRRTDEELMGRMFSRRWISRVSFGDSGLLGMLKKRNPVARKGREETR